MSIVFEYTVVKGALGVGKWDLLKITASRMVQFFSLNLSLCWPLINADQTTDQRQLAVLKISLVRILLVYTNYCRFSWVVSGLSSAFNVVEGLLSH